MDIGIAKTVSCKLALAMSHEVMGKWALEYVCIVRLMPSSIRNIWRRG